MNVLLLCGYFENEFQHEIGTKTKTWVENAANTFQERLIKGLRQQKINLTVVSAPFVGAWPTVYKDIFFHGFKAEQNRNEKSVRYVHFNNIWGYRNISRTSALKREVDIFLQNTGENKKAIIVYSPHTPFLEAAVYAKKKKPDIHIHLVVPDLPQYMNLSKKAHPIYDFFKGIDIKRFFQLNEHVDSYMLLTEPMAEVLKVGKRPYFVTEAIIDEVPEQLGNGHEPGKTIAYAGKLTESFGIKRLIDAFELLKDPEARLEICGGGELCPYVDEMCRKDNRITYHGQVTSERAQEILRNADILVNPRTNDDEYTKYSFPSKNVEYLLTGNKVVAYMLDGVPCRYAEFMFVPSDNSETTLAKAICSADNANIAETKNKIEQSNEYMREHLVSTNVVKKMIELFLCK